MPLHSSRRELLIGGAAAAVGAMLPACRKDPPPPPPPAPPAGAGFRRKNLSTDFTREEQRELSDLVWQYLTPDVIHGHMHQVDHLDNLFSDHRTFLYEIERKLIRDGHVKYVPLPYWEPINDLPDGWDRVQEPYQHLPLLPFNMFPKAVRPEMPVKLRPENIAASNFATAQDVALEIGRSARSAPRSYHFKSHAIFGGPFISMTTAASALIFWAYHGLLVDVYDKWLSIKFPGTNRRTVVGRHGDSHLELLTVTSHHQLWHARQRLKTMHYNDMDQAQGDVDVTFPHWSHWFQIGADKAIADVTVTTDHGGQLALLAQVKGSGAAAAGLVMMRHNGTGWGPWIALDPQPSEIRDAAVSLNADNTLAIFAVRRTSGGDYVVSTKNETAPRSNTFGAWSDVIGPGAFERLAIGRYRGAPHLVVTTGAAPAAGQLSHLVKDNGGWAQRVLATEPFTAVQMAANTDGRPEILAIKGADRFAYRKYLKTAGADIHVDANWSDWERVGSGSLTLRALAVAPHQDGRLAMAATDSSGKVHHVSQESPNGAWSGWQEIPSLAGMGTADELVMARDYTNCLRVFVRGADNFTYVAEQVAPNAGSWIGWASI